MLYAVKYTGPFGYLKPWTAVRDGETYSQQFLTPSVIEGMRQKLGVAQILRHRLSYDTLSQQQEVVHARAFKEEKRTGRILGRDRGILLRNVLLNPVLHLAFSTREDAERAARQHLCLCRNEDLVLPTGPIQELSQEGFEALDGFELHFTEDGTSEGSFLVGFNRFTGNAPMYGQLSITGRAVRYLPQS
ncbi:hypothetical protein [Hymenobacter sublimis]|uniref:Uncharacterized protein n=1 Tax=Hymenobacter sublimis TaxID=2933777 RepID=A0ABY4J742_9BACT|nr:hypothetical protein [Hymenobacter sublimis]UPL47651.1 hypothetical protein MWH26_10620 [Hymenobacter sublimis]